MFDLFVHIFQNSLIDSGTIKHYPNNTTVNQS